MSNEDEIRALIETWARAVGAGDRKAILGHHSPALAMFDLPDDTGSFTASPPRSMRHGNGHHATQRQSQGRPQSRGRHSPLR